MGKVIELGRCEKRFAGCPECSRHNAIVNIGREHWAYCDVHHTCWRIGENLFSSWRHQSEEDWERNAQRLDRYRVVSTG